ncbi:MAG: hypothetical protein J2P25_26770, partial [Nocardiopsaceae bacterium]|nr:hypothetical protein [Nocardiopsaceae bacterium]
MEGLRHAEGSRPSGGSRPSEGLWSAIGDDGRDPRLAYFASGGELDGVPPSGRMLGVLECLAVPYGPESAP